MKKKPLLPTSDLAKRFCAIMHRREITPWLDKEVRAFRLIRDHILEDDMLILERYYKAQWPPNRDKNMLRHDLGTLLNNFQGEIDRARIWCELHPVRSVRKIIPMPPAPSEPYNPSTDPVVIAQQQRFLEELKARKKARGQ